MNPKLRGSREAQAEEILDSETLAGTKFFKGSNEDRTFLLASSEGWPIELDRECQSERLAERLHREYGLNRHDKSYKFIAERLRQHARQQGERVTITKFSHGLGEARAVLVAREDGSVIRVTDRRLSLERNGASGVIFEQAEGPPVAPISNRNRGAPKRLLRLLKRFAFDPDHASPNVQLLFALTFLLACVIGRAAQLVAPLFAVMGDHGTGKSTLLRVFLRILVGPRGEVRRINPNEHELFVVGAREPCLLALDNLERWPAKLNDAMSSAATGGELVKRKLYSDSALVTQRFGCLVALTSRHPPSLPSDLASRLVGIRLLKPQQRLDDITFLREVEGDRAALWNELYGVLKLTLRAQKKRTQRFGHRLHGFLALAHSVGKAIGVEKAVLTALPTAMEHVQEELVVSGNEVVDAFLSVRKADRQALVKKARPPGEWLLSLSDLGVRVNLSPVQMGNQLKDLMGVSESPLAVSRVNKHRQSHYRIEFVRGSKVGGRGTP